MKHRYTRIASAIFAVIAAITPSFAGETAERIYLSGKGPSDAVEWDFFCSKGMNSGEWTKIPVPSNWEQHGFGGYDYGRDKGEKSDETGTYRTKFFLPEEWKDKHVRLVFEGSMTETSIKINGQPVGATNYGGYVPFRFLLNKFSNVEYGKENELEVFVRKKPTNFSLDEAERRADYWIFGGIYRPVYLEVLPKAFVNRVSIDAKADGSFKMDVFPQVQQETTFRGTAPVHIDEVVAQIQTREGANVGKPMVAPIYTGAGRVRFETEINNPKLWSPEYPNLYQVRVALKLEGEEVSHYTQTFGFRSFELRVEDGLYLNGKKILIQGVNRNVFDPQHGRAIDPEEAWNEARMIKAMNVNLVRSHMPPTFEFMRACDELGMMVITELTNWHDPYIDTPIARNIAYEIVTSYQNYPSVVFWANGNESGFNLEIDELYHLYDLQDRTVIHPWTHFEGIDTQHYPNWEKLQEKLASKRVYLPTEFLHGLYDGGHGAGMEDYWNAIRASNNGAGGVLWCWADAAIARSDQGGTLDPSGNRSADGIVGPNGEKEGSYYTVREIWSPIQIAMESLPSEFNGLIPVENRYYETPLNECTFSWKLVDVPSEFDRAGKAVVKTEATIDGPKVKPGKSGRLKLSLPSDWKQRDILELSAVGNNGVEVMRWSWPIDGQDEEVIGDEYPKFKDGSRFKVEVGEAVWHFSPKTGQLVSTTVNGKDTGLSGGPNLYVGNVEGAVDVSETWKATVAKDGKSVVIDSKGDRGSSFRWTIASGGRVTLDYSFEPSNDAVHYGAVGFGLEEELVESKRWLGKGPHRVWGNRMKGPQHGLWENEYNDVSTGQEWGEIEFKGIFSDIDWMSLALKTGASIVLDAGGEAEVGVLSPKIAEGVRDKNSFGGPVRAYWRYPQEGGLYLFHKLPGVGTKFAHAQDNGPQGQPSVLTEPLEGSVVFTVR
ncbi:glycoside hydrolase family 2 TIM barrel-domain containing protein [Pelagicoccus mobilis]|uniref:beta-galactosidase n=1 Tax=Pelagicoccus mobilis TaxID=415221 RepID=A0A934S017_9BACT|nr:glycoside hydrolase family 2 TIM barrel-domain containing protein [Pelagicoccus mobilis]MBK1879806.1 hypothetical protein [Pelagicoccus mobilis]